MPLQYSCCSFVNNRNILHNVSSHSFKTACAGTGKMAWLLNSLVPIELQFTHSTMPWLTAIHNSSSTGFDTFFPLQGHEAYSRYTYLHAGKTLVKIKF